MSLRIVLIHAVPMAIEPIVHYELWPEPEIVNLFDDSLSVDRANQMFSRRAWKNVFLILEIMQKV